MKKYLLEPGFNDDSVLYEIRLVEVARAPHASMEEIIDMIKMYEVHTLVVDAAHPSIIDRLKMHFMIKKLMRLPRSTSE